MKKRKEKNEIERKTIKTIFIFQLTFAIFTEVDFKGETVSETESEDFEDDLLLFEVS